MSSTNLISITSDFIDKGVFYELNAPPLSPLWHKYRTGVSATGVGSICGKNKFKSREAYKAELLNTKVVDEFPVNEDIKRGHDYESVAANLYSRETGYKLRVGSLCVNKECLDLSATPDRFIVNEDKDTNRLVEIKCPRRFADYVYDNYYLQFLTQMWVTGKRQLDYVQYVDGENRIMEVTWNQRHWDDAFKEITKFIEELKLSNGRD